MNDLIPLPRAVVEQVLDFVEFHSKYWNGSGEHPQKIVSDLRQALEAEQVEPVRKMYVCNSCQFPYADQPPSQCDCLGDETYTEAYLHIHPQPAKPQPEPVTCQPSTMKKGGRYNWKGQPERLVYVGRNRNGHGLWHQFEKVGEPGVVWCEVLDADLVMLEETP